MIPKECKRLAEVDFPIAVVSRHAAREKSIRHGHPSTLHLWWARRPLASSRAVLMALLLPDPCDEHCPAEFRRVAARQIRELAEHLINTKAGSELLTADLKSDLRSRKQDQKQAAEREAGRRAKVWRDVLSDTERWTPTRVRSALLQLLAQGSAWEWSRAEPFLSVCRNLVKAAHGDEPPLVVDPFAGGGSIPLEALRLGCDAFASDLNPVACLILKVMLEDIPRHGPELAEELRKVGGEIKRKAERELADLYPKDPDGATPIAYLWARTVRCEAPNCGAEIPLMRSFWLCKKEKRKRALRQRMVRSQGKPPRVEFEVFEPKTEHDVHGGTVTRAKATCVCCLVVLPPERVRSQLAAQRGGADVIFDAEGNRTGGARMTAVVTLKPGEKGRHYRLPTDTDYAAVRKAQEHVSEILAKWERGGKQGLCPVPDEPTPTKDTHRAVGSQLPLYNITTFGDLFTARQKVALVELGRLTASAKSKKELLALALTRAANAGCSLCRWHTTRENHEGVYSRQALPLVWDYSESNPFSDSTGGYAGALDWIAKVAEIWPQSDTGQIQPADATDHPLPDQSAGVWFTDPPYYDAVPYADLSDFFLVWLKRALPGHPLLRDPFDADNALSPKNREAVQCEKVKDANGSPKDKEFYEGSMARAFAEGRRVLNEDGVGSVVFAHKTTEGWEALLSGMIRGGWIITGSWPIATEMGSRLNARDTASLSTSVHLICRPRPENAPVGDWANVLQELPVRVADWMERLQSEGVRGADLVFACVGPALEIFSRHPAVETVDGREVGLPEYLEKVWEVVGRAALEQVLGKTAAGALEQDARLTALFLWTLQSTETSKENGNGEEKDEEAVAAVEAKQFSLPFDVVRRFAQPMGIDLDVWTDRVIGQDKGVVRLLPVAERARALFGEDGAGAAADSIESDPNARLQQTLFPEMDAPLATGPRRRGKKTILDRDAELQTIDATALDRVHAAMLLQSSGHANALRTLIGAEQDRSPDFLRLANALSALYPRGSQEKRLLDAMLLAVPR